MSCEIQISAVVENLEEVQTFFGLAAISGKYFFFVTHKTKITKKL